MAAINRSGKFPVWRWVILLVAGVYFLLPLYAALRFAGVKAFGSVFTQPGFGAALWTSIQISAMTWVITMALMVPTTRLATPTKLPPACDQMNLMFA